MEITLNVEETRQAVASITRFGVAELDLELSDIQSRLLLNFFLKEIAPSVYNHAIADAQTFLRDRLLDLEATCYAPEFTYWPKGSVRRK